MCTFDTDGAVFTLVKRKWIGLQRQRPFVLYVSDPQGRIITTDLICWPLELELAQALSVNSHAKFPKKERRKEHQGNPKRTHPFQKCVLPWIQQTRISAGAGDVAATWDSHIPY